MFLHLYMNTIYGTFVKLDNHILSGCYESRLTALVSLRSSPAAPLWTSIAPAPWALDPAWLTPGQGPKLLWGGQENQAGNERTLVLEEWHDLDPHTRFQPRTFELNVIQWIHAGFYYMHVSVGMYQSSSGCFLALIILLRCVLSGLVSVNLSWTGLIHLNAGRGVWTWVQFGTVCPRPLLTVSHTQAHTHTYVFTLYWSLSRSLAALHPFVGVCITVEGVPNWVEPEMLIQ